MKSEDDMEKSFNVINTDFFFFKPDMLRQALLQHNRLVYLAEK